MMRQAFFALVLVLQVACGPRAPGPDVPAQSRPAADAGLEYAGVWQIEFALDSIRHLGAGAAQWSPAQDTSKWIAGRLEMTDSLVGARALASTFEILDTHKLAELDEATVAAAAPSDTIRVWVDGAKCDRRPLLAEYSIWIGHFTEGFEESRLVLCSDSTRGVWVRYSDDWSRKPQPKWPEPNDKYYPRYFVGFRGRMIGPYHYGHMGVADFELTVDSVLFVRPPRQSDCAETVRQGS
jgi:hypothetical protein